MQIKKVNEISEKTLQGVIESVSFMSSKFDSFKKQLKELVLSITDLKNENKRISEENLKIRNDLNTMSICVNTRTKDIGMSYGNCWYPRA